MLRLGKHAHTNIIKMALRRQDLQLLATKEGNALLSLQWVLTWNLRYLSVVSFSSPNSERRLDMEYNTDPNWP